MKHLVHAFTLLLCWALPACSSTSSSDDEPADPYADLFGAPDPNANRASVFGTWGTTFPQPDLGIETLVRMRLDPEQIKLAARCTKGTKAVTAGVTVPATVSETQAIIKQKDSQTKLLEGNLTCDTLLTAGTAPLALGSNGLSFGKLFLFEQKFSD